MLCAYQLSIPGARPDSLLGGRDTCYEVVSPPAAAKHGRAPGIDASRGSAAQALFWRILEFASVQMANTSIRYMVHDVDAALPFYVDALGFELKERMGPAIAMVTYGNLTLWLSGPTSSAARPMPDGRKPEPGGWNRLVVEIDDIQALHARLKELGVPFRNEIISGPGGSQVLCEDPSGNPIELFQPR